VEGFGIEGHVPAAVIHRLLRERPDLLGLAAPGMPAGSPGMEMPGVEMPPYQVISYDASGPKAVYEVVK
jgi:hypothetical protein